METTAVIMLIAGFGLIYGGLAWCIGIAWYHSKNQAVDQQHQSPNDGA